MKFTKNNQLFQFIKYVYYGRHRTNFNLKKGSPFIIIERGINSTSNLLQNRIHFYQQRRTREIGYFGYILLGVPITAFFLGTWQIQRYKWKLKLIADLNAQISALPAELPNELSELESMEYRPVKVRGRYLHDKVLALGPRSLIKGGGGSETGGGLFTFGALKTGYCVVTPFRIKDRDLTILVNRGWVPVKSIDKYTKVKPEKENDVEITGVVRFNEKKPLFLPKHSPSSGSWLHRDVDAMAETVGAAPVYIELVASETIKGGPIAGQTRINLRNEHVSYIVTWYSLAVITSWMWRRQFIRKLPLL